ncbi:MAG: AMP-binding protein [Burkholderiaceae bacterium]|nr:AMP-binding protein [Burkholderiaceae bacterium]
MSLNPLHENLLHRAVVGDLITRSAERFGNDIALVCGEKRVSFRELNDRACQAANAFLSMGIGRGDRVIFMTHNCLEYIYCRYGLSKIGAILVPINFMLKGDEIAYIVGDCQPKAIFVEDALVDVVRSAGDVLQTVGHFGWFNLSGKAICPQGWQDAAALFGDTGSCEEPQVIVESDDVATIMYTTGTESFPKGVMSTNLNYFMSLLHFACDCDFRRDDVLIVDIPLFHIAGSVILTAALTIGSRALVEYAPDPMNILRKTEKERVTYWVYPATLYLALPSIPGFERFDLSSLKKCVSFGSVMPKAALEKWQAIKPDLQWRDYWGQTESTPVGTTSRPEDIATTMGSIGIADTGVSVKVFDADDREVPAGEVGELVIRGPVVMKGYWNKPEQTDRTLANGWLHTGDLGSRDERGVFHFVDRKKDMIKTGGENVASQEVESALVRHPKVALAAVIAMPHPHWVEAVTAVVVLKAGQVADEAEIVAFCKEHLAGYKVPKSVIFAPQLPMTPNGKILKRKLREGLLAATQ